MTVAVINPRTPGEGSELECKVESSAKGKWDCCQLSQFCQKVEELNEIQGKEKRKDAPGVPGKKNVGGRLKKGVAAAREKSKGEDVFAKTTTENLKNGGTMGDDQFFHECAKKEFEKDLKKNDQVIKRRKWNPDHVHELQLGGHPTDPGNFKWLDSKVNKSIGSTLKNKDEGDFPMSADCCPSEEKYCAPPKDPSSADSKLLPV